MKKAAFAFCFIAFAVNANAQVTVQKKSGTVTQANTEKLALCKLSENKTDKQWHEGGVFYGFKPEQEVLEKRTGISKTFKNSDGSYTAVFAGITHYKDENGAWQDVNYNLSQNNSDKFSAHKYSNTTAEIKSYFPEKPGTEGVVMSYNGLNFSWWNNSQMSLVKPDGEKTFQYNAAEIIASVSDNTIVYSEAYPGISEEFVILENGLGIENNVIINYLNDNLKSEIIGASVEFSQFIPLQPDWQVISGDNIMTSDFTAETFQIKPAGNEKQIFFNPVIIFDNKINNKKQAIELLTALADDRLTKEEQNFVTENIIKGTYKIHFTINGIELTVSFPQNWLLTESRSFPVTIDPTVTVGAQTTGYNVCWNGYYTDTRFQALYLSSDLTGAGLPNGAIITAFEMNASSIACVANIAGLKIRIKNTTAATTAAFENTDYTDCWSGSQNLSATGYYMHTFSTNYTFNSAYNLLIDFTQNLTTYPCASTHDYWWTWLAATDRARYTLWTSDGGDPQTATGGTTFNYLPHLRITYFVAPVAPIFYNTGSASQLAFNNSYINDNTPLFRASATHTASFNRFFVEINTASDFTGTAYTQTFSGTYTSGTQYDLDCSGLSPALPTTDGVTYYVRAKASADGGTNYGSWSSGTYSFTYKASGYTDWFQTTDAQFNTGTLSTVQTYGSNQVRVTAGGAKLYDYSIGAQTDKWCYYTAMASGASFVTSSFIQAPGTETDIGASLYSAIAINDGTYVGLSSANPQFWHFKYTITESAANVTQIDVLANVYSVAAVSQVLYIWNNSTSLWESLMTISISGDNDLSGSKTTNCANYINGSSQVNVCVYRGDPGTTAKNFGPDYPKITVTSVCNSGTIRSTLIDYASFIGASGWSQVLWTDNETTGDIKYKVYYDVSGTPTIIPDGALAGNSTGFDDSPINISGLNTATYNKLYLYATLTNVGGTPYLQDWTVTCNFASCGAPTTNATTLQFTNVGSAQMTVGWTSGNGTNRIVVARQGSAVTWTPTNGNYYAANSSFGSGTDVSGSLEYVVYNGSANSVTVTNLTASTSYCYKIFEYNCTGVGTVYYTSGTPLAGCQATTAPAPEINIKQSSTNYACGSTYNFGNVNTGSFSEIIFTIQNLGSTNLTITTPLSGSGDYTITAQPTTPVASSSSTTFTVKFAPLTTGVLNGSTTIANNDGDENPCVINFTGTGVSPGGGCSNPTSIACGQTLTNQTTIGQGNNYTTWTCLLIDPIWGPPFTLNMPGQDRIYSVSWPNATSGGTIRITLTNVVTNDDYVGLHFLGNTCVGGTCQSTSSGDYLDPDDGLFLFTGTNSNDFSVPAGITTYYFNIDGTDDGVTSFDITATCFATGIKIDQTNNCGGGFGTGNPNMGVYTQWNGAMAPQYYDASTGGTKTICENIYIRNLGWEWLKKVDITVGSCFTNVTAITPNGINTGFHALCGTGTNKKGKWEAVLNGNTISWTFTHPTSSPPACGNTTWGDGNLLNGNYTCALYTFCFTADINTACEDILGLQNTLSFTDDGIGGTGNTQPSNILATSTPPTINTNCSPGGRWTGMISTDWDNINNWCKSSVPTVATNVFIPDGCNNYPALYSVGNPTCASITIETMSSLTLIAGKTLKVGGNITNNGFLTMMNGSFIECGGNWTNNGTFNSSGGGTDLVVFDDFTDGNYTANPVWTVKAGGFTAGVTSLYGTDAAIDDRISTPYTQAYGIWEFTYSFDVATTGAYVRYFTIMSADNADPGGGTADGYYVWIDGGATAGARLQLRRLDNGVATTLITSDWTPGTAVHTIKVTRSTANVFELFYDAVSKGTYTDNTYTSSSYMGVWNTGALAIDNHIIDNIKTSSGSGGTVTFNSTSADQTIGGSSLTTFYNLTIKNTGYNITQNMPDTVTNVLTLTDGVINTTSANLLTMNAGSCVSPEGGSAISFVSGPMSKVGATAFVFPTGDGTRWQRIGIGTPSASSEFEARFINSPYSNFTSLTSPILEVSSKRYWTLNKTSGGNCAVSLYWNDGTEEIIDDCTQPTAGDLLVAQWNGSSWVSQNNTAGTFIYVSSGPPCAPGSASSGYITSDIVTSFNPFTFGSKTVGENNPFPIELLVFNAICHNDNVYLNWSTASETNNDYFTVERSSDGINFQALLTVDGAGNSNQVINYSAIDENPLPGIAYYRLKQTDFDGKYEYSRIIVACNGSLDNRMININVFPNPAYSGESVFLDLKGIKDNEILIVVVNTLGEHLYSKVILTDVSGFTFEAIDPYLRLTPGIYYIIGSSNSSLFHKKLVIR